MPDPDDNCPAIPNEDQADLDDDGMGDVCDGDDDGDLVDDVVDNCPVAANSNQANADLDGLGDACDGDDDDDSLQDGSDNCPLIGNPGQENHDYEPVGTAASIVFGMRTSPTTVAVTDDDTVSAPIPIGFPFTFFNTIYTEVLVSTNGYLMFPIPPSPALPGCCSGMPIPLEVIPNAYVAGDWEGLNQG
ncbi:MAG: thrombospondin type 3 repeat-containing protein, partial [Actinomycetota bacterium]